MRITLTASGGSPVTLCDHGREGPSNLTLTVLRKIDVMEYVQGIYAKPVNRGNVLHRLAFTVQKTHATATAAQLHMLLIHTKVPATGTLVVELDDTTTRLVMYNATCEITPAPLIGAMSTISYALQFGLIDGPIQLLTQAGGQVLTSDGNPIFINQEAL